jgi:hypothetical protein
MPDVSTNAYHKQGNTISSWVWYETNAKLYEGQAVCYNYDYNRALGSSADNVPERMNRVEKCAIGNAQFFAGVAAREYPAVAGGQLIEIYVPGSVCNVYCKANVTAAGTRLTFDVTSTYEGYFRYEGLPGEGSAILLQTGDKTTAGRLLAKLETGPPSGGVEVATMVNNDAIGTLMVGGTTLVVGVAAAGGNCTYTLADGAKYGLRKRFFGITTDISTSDFVITVTTGSSLELSDAILATVTFVADHSVGAGVTLEWQGSWVCIGRTKTYPALAA